MGVERREAAETMKNMRRGVLTHEFLTNPEY
jgi:hypothetical protein